MTSTKPHTVEITYRRLSELRPFKKNARRHSRKQLAQIAASIQKFGFTNPVLIADDDQILAGHARLEAAKSLGMSEIPTVRLSQMTEDDRRAYVDWRHVAELSEAGRTVFNELKNICVWNKTNGGMGTFYRSKHEFVFVFKIGDTPHLNAFGLGETGRHRTNVWDYPGVNSPHAGRSSELEMHPTVKPVALVKDAILDCSRRGGIVLDIFGGSGTTLIAAERTGRTARLIEFDPLYCDVIVRRYEELTGRSAKLERTGQEFAAAADHVLATRLTEKSSNG